MFASYALLLTIIGSLTSIQAFFPTNQARCTTLKTQSLFSTNGSLESVYDFLQQFNSDKVPPESKGLSPEMIKMISSDYELMVNKENLIFMLYNKSVWFKKLL
jgi:hypothetical protein